LNGELRYYHCALFSYEQFDVVYRIYSRMYVSADDLAANRDIVQYMNLAERNILWDLAKEPNPVEPQEPYQHSNNHPVWSR